MITISFKRLCFGMVFLTLQQTLLAQQQLSITIDDPTTKETPLMNWIVRDSLILETLDKHNIKAALFICGMRVNNLNGQILLNNWDSRNHLMANHSYAHFYYNTAATTAKLFYRDLIQTDSLIRSLKNYTKLFRFPYLKEGNTIEKRDSLRAILNQVGYKNGYVTIDASDWYIDAQLMEALKHDSKADLTAFKEYYIKHILERVGYYDALAKVVFKRDVKHTLLLHHSLLNALFLDDLLIALKNNGWQLIDAKKAYQDELFKEQTNIIPCGESIVWQCAMQIASLAKTLRYPAEYAAYEKIPLENYLRKYKESRKP